MHGALDVVIIIMLSITKIEVQHVVSNGFRFFNRFFLEPWGIFFIAIVQIKTNFFI